MEQNQFLTDWRDLLVAFLHDPPDKALDIPGHEARARKYLKTALGMQVSEKEIKMPADLDASIAERLPMPTAGEKGARAVGPENGRLTIIHPMSGQSFDLSVQPLQTGIVLQTIDELIEGLENNQQRFLTLWRMLPEGLAIKDHSFALMPADTRIPDHSIWNHLDITSALKAQDTAEGVSFISFVLGPVQEFIASAYSVRDLWSGSMLLSWLTFQAMKPVVEQFGPSSLIYPSLRGLPWLDEWLRGEMRLGLKVLKPPDNGLTIPCLPNRFLAVVPGKRAQEVAIECQTSAKKAWGTIAAAVKEALDRKYATLPYGGDWGKRWDEQVNNYFNITTSCFRRRDLRQGMLEDLLSRKNISPGIRALARLIPKGHRPSYDQEQAGDWQATVEYAARLTAAQRSIRFIPETFSSGHQERFPKKCSLMGSFEQMGPDNLDESNAFWAAAAEKPIAGIYLRRGEKLCAVSLVKRFCGPVFFEKEMGLETGLLFEDTATVSAKNWLEKNKIDPNTYRKNTEGWNGQWLHWPKRESKENKTSVPSELWKILLDCKKKENPPAYYAILMLDGDDMGKWLAGEKAPNVGAIIHPKIKRYFEALGVPARQSLMEKRPVGPAMHAAISQALSNFAVHVVPQTVKKYRGTLIYSGGDDVLALLPMDTVMNCALELNDAFRGNLNDGAEPGYYADNDRKLLMMGPTATISGGIAVVHYKYDLRKALQEARYTEKEAKRAGKNTLSIRVCRRSGQHQSVLCPWGSVTFFNQLFEAFKSGASDRFAYQLAEKCETLKNLPSEAQLSQIRLHMKRTEEDTRQKVTGSGKKDLAAAWLADRYQDYTNQLASMTLGNSSLLEQFVWFIQTASFMARGREA